MNNEMCQCKFFDRDQQEIDVKKCIGDDGCFKPLTAEELSKYRDKK